MYKDFYGLRDKPFSMLPDPAFLYLSKKHQTALTLLEYGLMNNIGFCVISGETGAGKTTLLRKLLERIDNSYTVGMITNTHRSFGSLLDWVLSAFNQHDASLSQVEMHQKFMDFLITEYARNKKVLLIVDEAQNMSADTLEELRMLSNVNSEKDQLMQIILAGQPALKDTLRIPELMQFAQRIGVDYHLGSLDLSESCAYIQHRLSTAGASYDIFSPAACARIYNFSGGTPRLINLLCDTVMVYGFADQQTVIDVDLVDEMVQERMKDSVVPIVNRDHPRLSQQKLDVLEEEFHWIKPEIDEINVDELDVDNAEKLPTIDNPVGNENNEQPGRKDKSSIDEPDVDAVVIQKVPVDAPLDKNRFFKSAEVAEETETPEDKNRFFKQPGAAETDVVTENIDGVNTGLNATRTIAIETAVDADTEVPDESSSDQPPPLNRVEIIHPELVDQPSRHWGWYIFLILILIIVGAVFYVINSPRSKMMSGQFQQYSQIEKSNKIRHQKIRHQLEQVKRKLKQQNEILQHQKAMLAARLADEKRLAKQAAQVKAALNAAAHEKARVVKKITATKKTRKERAKKEARRAKQRIRAQRQAQLKRDRLAAEKAKAAAEAAKKRATLAEIKQRLINKKLLQVQHQQEIKAATQRELAQQQTLPLKSVKPAASTTVTELPAVAISKKK